MKIHLDMFQAAAVAIVVYYLGMYLKQKFSFLQKYCIPAPVVGGIVFSLGALGFYEAAQIEIQMDTTLQSFFMTIFFTSVGYTASLKLLKRGGLEVAKLLLLCIVLVVLQNLLGVGLANAFSINPLYGMATGSIPMVGGHGTAGSFGPVLESMGATGGMTVAIAAATFGLVMGSVIGGPIARRLIMKHNLKKLLTEADHESIAIAARGAKREVYAVNQAHFMNAMAQLLVAMGLGTLVTMFITSFGVTFPGYIGAMLVAAVIRNIGDLTVNYRVRAKEVEVLGHVSLSIFLAMALMGLKLWQLSDLALPLVVMLAAQTVMMGLYAYFVTFNVMGRDYEAAVLTAANCGFGMGATPNAMANMAALTERYGSAPKAFFAVPLVGSLFIDFFNGTIITVFLNLIQ